MKNYTSNIHTLNKAIQHSSFGDCHLIEFGGYTKHILKEILVKLEKNPHLDINHEVDNSVINSSLKDLIKQSLKNSTIRKELLSEKGSLDVMIDELRKDTKLRTKIIEVDFDEIQYNSNANSPKERMWNEIFRIISKNDRKALKKIKETGINLDDLFENIIIHRKTDEENAIYLSKKERKNIDIILSISPLQIKNYFNSLNMKQKRIIK